MKFNMKNRPKCEDYAGDYVIYEGKRQYKGFCHKDLAKWFEGFEKELREMMLSENELPCVRLFISKEILGDEK